MSSGSFNKGLHTLQEEIKFKMEEYQLQLIFVYKLAVLLHQALISKQFHFNTSCWFPEVPVFH